MLVLIATLSLEAAGSATARPVEVTPATVFARHVGIAGVVTQIAGRELWRGDTPIQLDGPIEVASGGTLIIEAGTRVEARVGSYILVTRDGRIEANGTLFEPIQMTCTVSAKYPGCWGGIVVAGTARINSGTLTSPVSPRSVAGGCLQTVDPIGSLAFGGCNDADDSGVLRYLRIEYAERGLHLAGAGSETIVEDIQANRTRNEGVLVTGGTVSLRELFLTANGTGLRWTGGWRGRGQSIAVQQDVLRFAAGIVGQNGTTTSAAAVDALPRSQPTLFNLTIIAQSDPANPNDATARALVLERGTAGTLRNIFLYAPRIGLDIGGSSTCTQIAVGTLTLRNVLTAGATALGEGTTGVGCPSTEAAYLTSAADQNTAITGAAGQLLSTNDLFLPDLRPVAGSALATNASAPLPGDQFFRGTAFIGAVAALSGFNSIPWFSGWTSPAPPPAPIPTGTLAGVVSSPLRGLLGLVRVTDASSGETTLTSATGAYSLTVAAGTALLDVSDLPTGCLLPQTRAALVEPSITATLNLTVNCPPPPGTARVSVGDGFACGLPEQGTFCWGDNSAGQLGNGTITSTTLPAVVATALTSISVGAQHVCGVTVGSDVRCWGAGTQGQLGDGAGVTRSLPVTVSGGPYLMVTSGGTHSCALTTDGRAFCWGANLRGQLGTGTTSTALSPVAVTGARQFATIAAGRDHTCALDVSGAAWCWGANMQGQLGDGTVADRATPVPVSGGYFFLALAGGGDAHTCATSPASIVRCWGANAAGQLGNASTVQSATPVTVAVPVALSRVALGRQHSCAIGPDAVAYCWGAGAEGQVGDGTSTSRSTPTAVQASARFSSLAGGSGTSCGVTFGAVTAEDNTVIISRRSLLCWGSNATGQFGRGSTLSATTPTAAATGLTFP